MWNNKLIIKADVSYKDSFATDNPNLPLHNIILLQYQSAGLCTEGVCGRWVTRIVWNEWEKCCRFKATEMRGKYSIHLVEVIYMFIFVYAWMIHNCSIHQAGVKYDLKWMDIFPHSSEYIPLCVVARLIDSPVIGCTREEAKAYGRVTGQWRNRDLLEELDSTRHVRHCCCLHWSQWGTGGRRSYTGHRLFNPTDSHNSHHSQWIT